MKRIITTGENAGSFHDPITGIFVCRGEKLEIRENQYNSPRIRRALSSGHLRLVTEKEEVKVNSDEAIQKLDKKTKAQFKKGVEVEKIANDVTLEQARDLAAINEVSVEEGDTVVDILTAILVDDEK